MIHVIYIFALCNEQYKLIWKCACVNVRFHRRFCREMTTLTTHFIKPIHFDGCLSFQFLLTFSFILNNNTEFKLGIIMAVSISIYMFPSLKIKIIVGHSSFGQINKKRKNIPKLFSCNTLLFSDKAFFLQCYHYYYSKTCQ